MEAVMAVGWNDELVEQLDWYWREMLRPRLEGLTDAEFAWEPVPGCWSVRPVGRGDMSRIGSGRRRYRRR
jgi:hypothetical protein